MTAARRRVRWFVAAHLGAVCMLYGVTFAIGGGWAHGLPPDLRVAAAPVGPLPLAAPVADSAVARVGLPDWAQRAELVAPWEPL